MNNYQTIAFNKHNNFNAANKTATQMLKSIFNGKNVLINNPAFLVSHKSTLQVTVQLSYYLSPNTQSFKIDASSLLGSQLISALSQMYTSVIGQPVSVQLNLVRQLQPYMNASILAQYLAINASKYGFNRMTTQLLKVVPLLNPSYFATMSQGTQSNNDITNYVSLDKPVSSITGIKVQLSGLLTSQRNRSRNSVYTASAGTFNLADYKVVNSWVSNNQLDYACYTYKSRLGAFTVKVWIASL